MNTEKDMNKTQLYGSSFSTLPYCRSPRIGVPAHWRETWVVFLCNSCTFAVVDVITQVRSAVAATNTSDLMSGNQRNRWEPILGTLTIQRATRRMASSSGLVESSPDQFAKFCVCVPCWSFGFRFGACFWEILSARFQ